MLLKMVMALGALDGHGHLELLGAVCPNSDLPTLLAVQSNVDSHFKTPSNGKLRLEGEVHEDDADAAEDEHEAGRESLDDVLAVDASGKEDDGADGSGVAILGGADAGGLDDDVVDDSGDDHEVGEEDKGENGHRGRKGEGGELEAEAREAEEAVGEDFEDVENWIYGICARVGSGGGGGGAG
ncbi:hypothetical protein L1049_019167 [Liquidambar formosana]|uniref:Uncharacterized protein n=1 Tax=Liquidambar formosana TaxID=63359 RepID=A0AAP0RB70_LIQFO